VTIDVAGATGVVSAMGGVGGFFLPLLLGLTKDLTGHHGTGLLLFAFVAVVAAIAIRARQVAWQASWLQPTLRR